MSSKSFSNHPNRLIHEASPYLRQHAQNPVDWYPWGEEALTRAKTEHKPILLSIGYSACHWCHVMERECFENADIAQLMNERFINIKVDREERPDLDDIYQKSAQAFTRRGGGWPLTIFLTPTQEPFFAGTYFPPIPQHGMPGFPQILLGVDQAFREDPDHVKENSQQILSVLRRLATPKPSDDPLAPSLLDEAAKDIEAYYEPLHGGFGHGPKFPMAAPYHLLFRQAFRTGNEDTQNLMLYSLYKIAAGGIYDHIGGGFHRYSVDAEWLVPHFEKMLYDNAQLVRLYLTGWRLTESSRFREVVEDTLTYISWEMLHPDGGFYSTQDADSEGEEGKFFTWTPDEITALLGSERGKAFCRAYNITESGNFEGTNICHLIRTKGLLPDEVEPWIREARGTLRTARDQRIKPLRDEKILMSWNGLMASAFLDAYQTFGTPAYLEIAERTLTFLLAHGFHNGRLFRCIWNGKGTLNAYLDDYAFLIAALLDAFEATGKSIYLTHAQDLTATTVEFFWDGDRGGYFFTSSDHESLIQRMMVGHDSALPSGNAIMAMNLLRLFSFTQDSTYQSRAESLLKLYRRDMVHNAYGMASMLASLDRYLAPPLDIIILGAPDDSPTQSLLATAHSLFLPNKTVFLSHSAQASALPVFAEKSLLQDQPTAYVCHNFTCSRPVSHPADLQILLEEFLHH